MAHDGGMKVIAYMVAANVITLAAVAWMMLR